MWDLFQQVIAQKPPVCHVYLDLPVCLPHRRDAEQMPDQGHLNKNNGICPGPAVVMAIIRLQSFIQPIVIHDLLDFPQQMILGNKSLQIRYYIFFTGVFFSAFHPHTTFIPLYQKNLPKLSLEEVL